MSRSHLVQIVVEGGDGFLESLAFAGIHDDLAGLGGDVERIAREDLPVVEDALGERLTTRVRTQIGGEA